MLKVPASALFRAGSHWSAFTIEDGRARRVELDVGHRNASEAEIRGRLSDGASVILHPSNELRDGARVNSRR